MKKSTLKLVIRRETLRFLTEVELHRADGGNDATGGPVTECVNAPRMDSEGPVTGCVNTK